MRLHQADLAACTGCSEYSKFISQVRHRVPENSLTLTDERRRLNQHNCWYFVQKVSAASQPSYLSGKSIVTWNIAKNVTVLTAWMIAALFTDVASAQKDTDVGRQRTLTTCLLYTSDAADE